MDLLPEGIGEGAMVVNCEVLGVAVPMSLPAVGEGVSFEGGAAVGGAVVTLGVALDVPAVVGAGVAAPGVAEAVV